MNRQNQVLAVKGFVYNDDKKILLIKESSKYEEGTNEGRWDLPGGRLQGDKEEKPIPGLRREIKEETGLEIELQRYLDSKKFSPTIEGKRVDIIAMYYICRSYGGDVTLSEDHSEFGWFDPEEILEMQNCTSHMHDLVRKFQIEMSKSKTAKRSSAA